FDNDLVQLVFAQAHRHFVNTQFLVAFLDHGFDFDIAKLCDFLAFLIGQFAFGAANEDVRLNTDLAKLPDAVLGGLGLQLACGLQIRDERQVDVKAIGFADIQGKLPNGLKVGHAFDVADGAPDFSNDDVHVVGSEFVNRGLDLVGDVWNDLDGLA